MKNRKKTLKLVAATSICIFNLLVVFVACFAWFSSNVDVRNSGANMNVQLFDRRFRRMTLHKFVGVSDNNYQFKQDPSCQFTYSYLDNSTQYTRYDALVDGEDKAPLMEEYSLTSPTNPLLAIIEFSRIYNTNTGDDPITIKAQTDNPFICATDEHGDFVLGLDTESNPLSSVIKFSAASYSSFQGYTGTAGNPSINTYNLPKPSNNSWQHFVQIGTDNEGNYTYNNATGWNNEMDIITISGSPTQYVTIIFDYYEEALGYIYNKYLGDEVLERESVPFGCDWTIII